jgi:riboflavin biosynthesis pyrimidine reductase
VPERPYVLLSAAMSADGYIGDASRHALELSDAADWDRVDELRSLALSGVLLEPRFSAIGNDEV